MDPRAALANPKVRNSVAGAMLAAIVGLYAQLGDVRAEVAKYAGDREALRDVVSELKTALAEQRTTTTALQVQLARLEAVSATRRR